MEESFHPVHTFKDVFSLGRAGKMAKAKHNALGTDHLKKQKVEEVTNAETWTLSTKRREINTWWDYFSPKIDVSKELVAYYNFQKLHLTSHWVEQIRQYGSFQQYSAESHHQGNTTNLKDC
jgi:hypothetical protein